MNEKVSGWEENIRRTRPYIPGEQPKEKNIIKLNTNENPYPPCPGVARVLEEMDAGMLRRYPDPCARALTDAIAKSVGLDPSQIYVGVGSDDVLAMCFLTCFNSGKEILFPDITYSFYDVWAELFHVPYCTLPLNEQMEICPGDYCRPNGGIIFPNPNAPTGILMSPDQIETILAANPDSVVIVDEAYIAFGGTTVIPLIDKYENLLVVRTFSKSHSMAGMRIGFAAGSARLIGYLMDVRNSFNSYTMNTPSILAGVEAISDEAYFEKTRSAIIKTRERLKKSLLAMGFSFPDSKANFLFITHPDISAKELYTALRGAGILVRHFNAPRIDNYLRVSIGTDEETDSLIAFLELFFDRRKKA